METQPSIDANVAFKTGSINQETSGADNVARELDEFNAKYQYLIDELYKRLQEIAAKNPNDIVTLVSLKKIFFFVFFFKQVEQICYKSWYT